MFHRSFHCLLLLYIAVNFLVLPGFEVAKCTQDEVPPKEVSCDPASRQSTTIKPRTRPAIETKVGPQDVKYHDSGSPDVSHHDTDGQKSNGVETPEAFLLVASLAFVALV